jgi:hypothetical protein
LSDEKIRGETSHGTVPLMRNGCIYVVNEKLKVLKDIMYIVERVFWQAICQTNLSSFYFSPECTRAGSCMPWEADRRWQAELHAEVRKYGERKVCRNLGFFVLCRVLTYLPNKLYCSPNPISHCTPRHMVWPAPSL